MIRPSATLLGSAYYPLLAGTQTVRRLIAQVIDRAVCVGADFATFACCGGAPSVSPATPASSPLRHTARPIVWSVASVRATF